MKRLINRGLSLLMAVLMLLAVFTSAPVTISAADGDPEFVFERSVNHYDGSQLIKLVRYNGTDENIVIPERVPEDYPDETMRGKDFSIIRESAFFGNTNIKTVTIQNNVNHIGGYAFSDCTNLKEVTIGTNLDYLAASSFANCPALEKVTIYSQPSSFTMESGAFVNSPNVTVYGYHGSQVEAAIRGSSIPFKGIDHSYGEPVWSWDLYSSATAKFSCEYGDDTQEVEANIVTEQLHEASDHDKGEKKYTATATFEDKTYTDEKTEYTDPEHNVEYFRMHYPTPESNGHIAYRYCSDCGMYFSGEYGNEDIAENETILPYFSYEYSSDGFYKLIGYNGKDEDITVPAVIPDNYPDEALRGKTANIIREDAFKNNSTIKTVTILNNISHIGSDAFRDCSQLKEVTIGNNLDYFGYRCFENCTELEKVTIYSKDSRFGMQESSFSGCPNVVVYGYHGTAVEYYMNNYSIPFVSLGHAYGEPVWNWDGFSSATASFTCTKNDDTQTVDATITSKIAWAPSGGESGARQYTATVTFEGETYTNTIIDWFDYAASVTHNGNTVNFEDLSTASAAENWVEGSTLTLLTDVDITSSLTVPAGEHTLDLNGHGIRATGDQNFSVITVPADAELTLNDSGSITHKYTVENSLATVDDSLEGENVPTFTGGYITGGRGNNGGAVSNSGVFTMNAGTIIGNKVSSRGGGIFNSGTVNLTGGQIIYNVAQQWGGGIYMSDTAANTLNLSGGSITNNLCNNNGGGIQVSVNDKVNISGAPVVKDNYVTNGSINNINLSDGIIAVTGQLDAAALIGVRRFNGDGGVITDSEYIEFNNPDCFISDKSDLVVGKDMTSGQLKLHAPYTVTWKNDNGDVLETDTNIREGDVPTYDGSTPVKPNDEQGLYTFDKWSPDVTAAAADATYTATFTQVSPVAKVDETLYGSLAKAVENWAAGSTLTLLRDADVTSTITVPEGTHTLDLNGHGIRAAGDQNFSVITVPADAELTLNDSGSTTHKYSVENSLATVDDSLEGEDIPTFTGGYITGGRSNSGGAVSNSGVFTMNAGTIIGNKATSKGGGIYNSGTVNLTGGQIIYNVAQQWGAGIYMADTAANTLNLNGGSITNNLCNNNGGGIQVSANSKVNVSGDPVVKDNYSANGNKNNINLSDNGIINVTGQLDSAALIGVRRYDGAGVITAGENTDYNTVANFFSDNADYVVGKDMTSGQLKLHAPYTVTWKNYNDDVLETDTDLREGDIPTYDGAAPTRPDDEASFYVFDKWTPDVTAVSSDATYTATFTKYDAVAKVGDTLYLTFPEAVNAAEGAVITLLADIDEPYVLAEDQTIRVFHNEHQLTVNAPEGEYRVDTSTEGNAVAYRAAKLYAEVNGNKYESFSEAATVAAGVKNVTLLRDMPSAFSMNDHNSDILRVKSNGFEANITDYVRKENKKGVTYYYKKEADAYVDGDGVDLVDGLLIIGTGAAVVVELGAGGGAGVTVVVGAGAEVLIDGGSDADFEPENPEEECLEEEEQEDGSKKIKSLKYHWVKIDTGISILDAGAEVLPDCVNEIWETYNQNIATIVKILPPVLDIVGYTDVKLAFPYPEGWFFPPIPYLPEAMNPGSHFIGFFEGTSASSYGTPFIGKVITEDLDITGIWLPYEAAVIKPDGSLDYYMSFSEAAESRDGNIVKILSAPLTDYTLKKIGDDPAVYEVLKVKRGNYIGGSHVNEPSGVPEGYGMRTWTYTDEEDEVVTCYTIDGELTATFVYNNGSPDTTQTVYTNQLVEKPEDPVKPRCFFEGWYADEQLQQPFDFTQPIYNNVTLYAKWNETPGYTVQKVWDTGSNHSLRPDSVKAVLQQNVSTDQQTADWQTIETLTLSDENNWRGTFSTPTDSEKLFRIRELGHDKSDGSQGDVIYVEGDQEYVEPEGDDKRAVVTYSFTLGEYEYNPTYRVECTTDQNGNTIITNTLADRVLNIEKKWDIDLENKDRPESVQMVVQASKGIVWENVQLVTLSADNGWKTSVNVPGTRSAGGESEDIEYRVRELTEESLYSQFMSSIKESIFGGKLTYAEWTAKLTSEGLNVYNALPADVRNSIDQGYEALCRTLGVAENNPGGIYIKLMNILGLLSASDRVVYDRYDLDLQSLLDSKTPNRVTYNVSGYSSALTGGDVENHATTYKVSYSESGESFTVTNTAIQIVDLFKHWIPLGVEDEEMPDSAWLVLMSKPGVSDFENAKSMATEAGFDTSELANLELPVINPLEGGSGPFNVLSELVLDTDLSWVDTALGMPKIGVVKADEADGWKKTVVDKKYECGIPKEYRGAELSGEILRQIIKYLTDGAVDIPISYNFFSNYVTTGTKAYPELRWMSLDDFDMTEVIAKGKTVTQEDLDNFKPADLVFDKANLMTHIINVKFKAEPDEPENIEYPDSNILNGCKIWDGDEANRPEWLKIHVKEGTNEIEGSPVTLYKNDFVGKNLWTWTLTLDDSVDKHALTVTEEYPSDYEYSNSYTPTVLGAMIANTWTPDAPPVPVTGRYRFTHIDRYGDERTKTVEVTLKEEEINGYSGNNYQPGVPTYIWTAEAQELFGKNPLLTAALAVTGNTDEDQKDVSVYKNDVEWDLIKLSADEATNMTPDSEEHTLTVLAKTKPYTFTFNYYFVKDGSTQYRGTLTDIEYGKPVTFDPNYRDPEKYAYIEDTIPSDEFCYWSADEAGLIPITTNLTFGMLLRGKWHDDGDSERAVSVYAQYNNNLTEDWVPLIEETAFTHMIDDDNDWVYLDYMTNYVSKDGKVVQDMVAEGDENIRYGLIAVKRPADSQAPDRDQMIGITQMMIGEDKASAYVGDDDSMVAYRFEYGKQEDTVKPISNFNRVLYTLRSDTEKAENRSFSVIAYITVDGQNYYYSEVNNDIDVHELLNQ